MTWLRSPYRYSMKTLSAQNRNVSSHKSRLQVAFGKLDMQVTPVTGVSLPKREHQIQDRAAPLKLKH